MSMIIVCQIFFSKCSSIFGYYVCVLFTCYRATWVNQNISLLISNYRLNSTLYGRMLKLYIQTLSLYFD